MKFFSGFGFQGERELFDSYLQYNDFCVAGFSYGAIKAFKYTFTCRSRIDKLQLFSPAFFQDKDEKFKRLQSLFFAKNSKSYMEDFLKKATYPSNLHTVKYQKNSTLKELKELLNHRWDEKEIQTIKDKNIEIEVYLGELDSIINPNSVLDFFKPFATVYYIKNVGHMLI
ncbi:MAG: pimelyl-ACP methyl ester esterase BioV [Sulfurospirillum sp.]